MIRRDAVRLAPEIRYSCSLVGFVDGRDGQKQLGGEAYVSGRFLEGAKAGMEERKAKEKKSMVTDTTGDAKDTLARSGWWIEFARQYGAPKTPKLCERTQQK